MCAILPKLTKISLIILLIFSQIAVAEKKFDITLKEASEFVRLQTNGKILSARTTNFNRLKAHRIQVLTTSGRIKIYQVPVNRQKNKPVTDYIYNGRYYSNDRSVNIRSHYSNNRAQNNNFSMPKNYRQPTITQKGDSKTK